MRWRILTAPNTTLSVPRDGNRREGLSTCVLCGLCGHIPGRTPDREQDVSGQSQVDQNGSEQSISAPIVLSDALAEHVKELLAASEVAARAVRARARADAETICSGATRAAMEDARLAMGAPSEDGLPQLEASVSELRELIEDLRTDVDRLATELTLVGEDPRALPPPPDRQSASGGFDRRALMIALNMASNGASRVEAADYLAQNLDIRDCDELLDAVYGYVDSSAA